MKMNKGISILLSTLCFVCIKGTPIPYPITQEQLAQFVAAQQTQQLQQPQQSPIGAAQHRYVTTVAIPRTRQTSYQEPEQTAQQVVYQQDDGSDDSGAYQEQPQAGGQPILYYRQQQQPQQLQQPRPAQYKKYASPKLRPSQLLGSKEQDPEEYDPNPQYQFSFDIKDDESTNYHNRKETRDGDKISGSYSVVDSDGYIRTVTYTADPREGFKADVNRQPTDIVVKLPKHPAPGLAQQYQQISPSLLARKQQTKQYLEAASSIEQDPQQYAINSPQPQQVYVQPQSQRAAYFAAPHRLSPAVVPVAAAKAQKSYNPAAGISPLLYKTAYQQ